MAFGGVNLAALGIRVGANGATRTLNQFSASAANAGRATEKFERSTKNLTATLGALGGFFGVRQMVEYADTWTLISARIGLVTKSTEEMMTIQERLFGIAVRTRNTLAATSVLYTRTALNADQLGRSTEELLEVTEAVNSALLLSGATGVEAAQSMRQLAQAFSKGVLDGDEFRTVMEAMPLVSRALAEELVVTIGELRELAPQGALTVQVLFDALIKKNEEWKLLLEDMPYTMGQAFEVMNAHMVRMVGIINHASGITQTFARWILTVAKNLDKIAAAFGGLVIAATLYKASLIAVAAWQAIIVAKDSLLGWIELSRHIGRAAAAMRLLKMNAQGIGGVLLVIATAAVGLVAYKLLLDEITEATEKWINANADLTEQKGERVDPVDEAALKARQHIEDMIRLAHQEVVLASLTEERQKAMAIAFDAVNQKIDARRELNGDLLTDTEAAIDLEQELLLKALEVETAFKKVQDALDEQRQIIKTFTRELQTSFADMFVDMFERGIDSFSDLFSAIKRMFLRLVAEMSAAKIMQSFGPQLTAALAGIFGVAENAKAQAITDAASHLGGPSGMGTEEIANINAWQEAHGLAGVPSGGSVLVTVDNSKELATTMAQIIGPALAGFAIGRLVGAMTTNPALGAGGGALSGAASGAMIGSALGPHGALIGGIAGGIAGAIGGFMGASEAQRAESERLRAVMEEHMAILEKNSITLQELADAFNGVQNRNLFDALTLLGEIQTSRTAVTRGQGAINQALLDKVAADLGIVIRDGEGNLLPDALRDLEAAIHLTIQAMTAWGNNLSDATQRQAAYNQLFGIEDTPLQGVQDTAAILQQLAPELFTMLGLDNVDLTSPEGRETFAEALREIFRMIDSGFFTDNPELLGAFEDKDGLIRAVLDSSKALDEFQKMLFKITTDFPRAMDIIFYEQLFGTYGLGRSRPARDTGTITPGPVTPGGGPRVSSFVVQGDITIINESGDSGEDLLSNLEGAVIRRRTLGGTADLIPVRGSLF